MRRVAVFLATVAVVLAGVAALDWWIDPLLDRYDPKPLAAALEQPKPCFLGIDVFSTRAYSELKFDYFRQRVFDLARDLPRQFSLLLVCSGHENPCVSQKMGPQAHFANSRNVVSEV